MAAYEFRARKEKQKQIYVSSSGSETDESDSSNISDPDYSRIRPPRRRRCPPKRRASNGVVMAENQMENGYFVERNPSGGRRRRRRRRGRIHADSAVTSISVTDQSESRKGTILSWLIDMQMFEENAEVIYLDQTQKRIMLGGRVTRGGIICRCCEREITVNNFEVHARSNQKRPYENIFLAISSSSRSRVSLFDCQIEALQKIANAEAAADCSNRILPNPTAKDKSDDACLICADGGNLICCEKCPSTFHLHCIKLERVPQGDWLCPYCACKYCGLSGNEREGGLHPCCQCQKRYHWSCYLRNVGQALDLNRDGSSFCGLGCKIIFETVENIVGAKIEHCGEFYWRILKQKDITQSSNLEDLRRRVTCNSKLAIAWSIMDSSLQPILDCFTRSNFNRINFEGFYTVVLERAEEIISVACLRIHGTKVAELPFIATQKSHRDRGMCQKLLVVIESALCYLNVEKVVIPSAVGVQTMWMEKFGFCPVDDFVMKDLVNFNTLMFPGAIRLQKILKPHLPAPFTTQDIGDGRSVITTNNRPPKLDLNVEPPSDDESLISTNKISSDIDRTSRQMGN